MDEKQRGLQIYRQMVDALKASNWNFEEDEERLTITSGYQGDDIPIRFHISVYDNCNVLHLVSYLPFDIKEDKRIDAALALAKINPELMLGNFNLDLNDGSLFFTLNFSYDNVDVHDGLYMYLISMAMYTIDKFNDKIMMLNNGIVDIDQFFELLDGEDE